MIIPFPYAWIASLVVGFFPWISNLRVIFCLLCFFTIFCVLATRVLQDGCKSSSPRLFPQKNCAPYNWEWHANWFSPSYLLTTRFLSRYHWRCAPLRREMYQYYFAQPQGHSKTGRERLWLWRPPKTRAPSRQKSDPRLLVCLGFIPRQRGRQHFKAIRWAKNWKPSPPLLLGGKVFSYWAWDLRGWIHQN